MVYLPTPKFRKERLDEILKVVRENKKVDARTLFANMSIQYGISRRRFKEYVQTLEEAGLIIYDLGKEQLIYAAEE